MIAPDALEAEGFSALGERPLLMLDVRAAGDLRALRDTRAILIGLDPEGALPAVSAAAYDLLLTIADDPPAPWVAVPASRWHAHLSRLDAAVRHTPIAAQTGLRLLRIAEALPFELALEAESHAYSMLLAGAEFARWRAGRAQPAGADEDAGARLSVTRDDDRVTITLDHPARRNAFAAPMRDQLFEALAAVIDDPSAPAVVVQAAGPCFSVGGDLGEFGASRDPAAAHAIRTERSCARLLHRIGDRATVRVQGACIGSGLEVAAAAAHRIADARAWFQLPELTMGLIPGAGGTATVMRAMGRHRTAWMMLSNARVPAATAHRWGLVHEVAA